MARGSQRDWLTQVRRGLLELCILALIGRESTYGYALVTRLADSPRLAAGEGTVYPLLRRLRRDGLLDTEWVESDAGPPRQYYTLTDAGRERLATLRREWIGIVEAVEAHLDPEDGT